MGRPKEAKRNKDLCRYYKSNRSLSIAAAGRQFNMCRERARQILAAAGIETRRIAYDWNADPEKRVKKARKLYRSGVTFWMAVETVGRQVRYYFRPTADDRKAFRTARFWQLVEKKAKRECWPWLGKGERAGYPVFDYGGNSYMHAALFMITRGRKPKYRIVRLCPRRDCANPRHVADQRSYNEAFAPMSTGAAQGQKFL